MSTTTETAGTDPRGRSAAAIEREVEATRAGVSQTLEALRDRASPGQLFEQAMEYVRSSGGADMARNLGRSLRDNPLPILLVGAGVAWMMMSGSRPATRRDAYGDRYSTDGWYFSEGSASYRGGGHAGMSGMEGEDSSGAGVMERAAATADDAARAVGDVARSAGDAVRSAADSVAGVAQSAWDSVRGAATSAFASAESAASDGMRSVAGAGHMVRRGADQASHGARDGLDWVVREQPLVLGALGLAVGAAIGALLPGTEAEDRLMGESRDAVLHRARAGAEEGLERARSALGEQAGRAREAVGEVAGEIGERSGGEPLRRMGDALGDAAREVRHAVTDAARGLADEAQTALAPGDDAGRTRTPERDMGRTGTA